MLRGTTLLAAEQPPLFPAVTGSPGRIVTLRGELRRKTSASFHQPDAL